MGVFVILKRRFSRLTMGPRLSPANIVLWVSALTLVPPCSLSTDSTSLSGMLFVNVRTFSTLRRTSLPGCPSCCRCTLGGRYSYRTWSAHHSLSVMVDEPTPVCNRHPSPLVIGSVYVGGRGGLRCCCRYMPPMPRTHALTRTLTHSHKIRYVLV